MRLWCWYCHKPVSSELPDDALFRAIAVCPECIDKSTEAEEHPLSQTMKKEKKKELLRELIAAQKQQIVQYLIEVLKVE